MKPTWIQKDRGDVKDFHKILQNKGGGASIKLLEIVRKVSNRIMYGDALDRLYTIISSFNIQGLNGFSYFRLGTYSKGMLNRRKHEKVPWELDAPPLHSSISALELM